MATKNKKILAIILGLFLIGAGAFAFYTQNTKIEMSLKGDKTVTIEYGDSYKEEGVKATSQFLSFSSRNLNVNVENSLDETKLGEQQIVYKASVFFKSKEITRTVNIVDTTKPEITLSEQGDYIMPDEEYQEDGYQATDNFDGDLTNQVERVEKDGIVTYTVADSSGNETVVTREIKYADVTAPVITLSGSSEMSITQGDSYSEPGYSANDDRDGDITANVKVEGSVDPNTVGSYVLTYTVADAFGNSISVTRKVTVNEKKVVNIPTGSTNGNKIVYLTFDDGPGPYTQQLLNVLAKYNVKATFFVTAQYPGYLNMIGAEVAAGHSVGIHTYSHNYQSVYSSVDNFYADFNKMASIIQQYGGITPTISRFPGGSSNAVSKQYCAGIMTSLTQSVVAKGYQYFDWNVSSGDAGGTTDSATVASNVISGISKNNVSVVLQHDIKQYSVAAVEQIIVWGLNNGYTFLPLTNSSYAAHHHVNN